MTIFCGIIIIDKKEGEKKKSAPAIQLIERSYKMTKREFFTAIINGEQNEELQNFAKKELKKIEDLYVKRTYKTKTKNEEINAPLIEEIFTILCNEPLTSLEISEILNISIQKTSFLLNKLFKENKIEKKEIKIKGKGKVNTYTLKES